MLLRILRSRLIIQDLREYQLLKEFWEVISVKIPVVFAGTRYNLWNTETGKPQPLSTRPDTKGKTNKQNTHTPPNKNSKKNPQNSHTAKLQMLFNLSPMHHKMLYSMYLNMHAMCVHVYKYDQMKQSSKS